MPEAFRARRAYLVASKKRFGSARCLVKYRSLLDAYLRGKHEYLANQPAPTPQTGEGR